MHKIGYLFFVLTLLFIEPIAAQQRFSGRLVGGGTLAQIDGDQLSGFNKVGAQAGIKVYTYLNERWSWSVGLLYSQQGARLSLNDSPSAVFDRIQLNFVEAPFMIHFTDWKFQLGAGMGYGRLIDYTVEDILGDDVSASQEYQDNLFQALIGVTFNFTDKFGLDVRWSRQINNLQSNDSAGTLIARAISIRGLYRL